MKYMKLTDLVEDILKEEGKHLWDAPNKWAEYKDKDHATSELKKFPSALRKYFKVRKSAATDYAIQATNAFFSKAKKWDDNFDFAAYELGGFEVGLDDIKNPHYIVKFRESVWA